MANATRIAIMTFKNKAKGKTYGVDPSQLCRKAKEEDGNDINHQNNQSTCNVRQYLM
jgi:hypothetical protein